MKEAESSYFDQVQSLLLPICCCLSRGEFSFIAFKAVYIYMTFAGLHISQDVNSVLQKNYDKVLFSEKNGCVLERFLS